ncbi:hypothetical protein B0J18DRAFT_302059 [Chaetomium sp. MPI-SDFR-AT-0129]|nr:hypothetical protein B0J18DRAFT_302059 [Chaetomium sp. MPI-SDFR-AT-0129]
MERVREYAEAIKAFRAQSLVLMHVRLGQRVCVWESRAEEPWLFSGSRTGARRGGGRGKQKKTAARSAARKRRASPTGSLSYTRRAEEEEEDGAAEGEARAGPGDGEAGGQESWWQLDVWDMNRVSRQIAKVLVQYMGEKLGIMLWRHGVKAIYRRGIVFTSGTPFSASQLLSHPLVERPFRLLNFSPILNSRRRR